MPVLDLYSYRKRLEEDNAPDVFTYDDVPYGLRVQIVHILRDAVGLEEHQRWKVIHDAVAREHELLVLNDRYAYRDRCETYLLEANSHETALDFIEASFRYLELAPRRISDYRREERIRAARAASQELNERFRRAGVGYQFEDGQIFRVDSELIHSEVVRPALRFLHQRGFEGPREEFLRAHACYRAGDTKEAVTNANNAFESTLKAICMQRRWSYPEGATAPRLVKVVRDNGLFPSYLEKSFDQLAATLKSGVPEVRNEAGGHGQGPTPRETPDYVAAYALHLAAASILFLVEAHQHRSS